MNKEDYKKRIELIVIELLKRLSIARCILWDRKQKKSNSRYWSYILEE